jgi:hypothetical protein
LIEVIKTTTENKCFIQKHRATEKDFTRRSPLSFQVIFFMIMSNLRSSLARELERFFEVACPGLEPPTDAALCQARLKLLPEAFSDMNQIVLEHFYQERPWKQLKGFRVLAVDGSTVRLRGVKADCAAAFAGKEGWDPENGTALARISLCYDVLNHLVLDSAIAPYSYSEQALAAGHVQHCGRGDLLLLDRNYGSFRLFRDLENRWVKFCARIKVKQWTDLLGDFLESDDMERILVWEPNSEQRRQCEDLGIPAAALSLRLVKVILNTGEIEVLITNLDPADWPVEAMAALYALRWGVEEEYKFAKSRSEMERWSGKSTLAVEQDFYGRLLLENLSSIFSMEAGGIIAKQTKNSKYTYQVNRTRALTITRDALYKLLYLPRRIIRTFTELTRRYAKKPCPIRPGRQFPRNFRPQADFSFPYKAFA